MIADQFLQWNTAAIMVLGLIAFVFDTAGGVLFAKFLNLFLKKKINPMVGAAGILCIPDVSPGDPENRQGRGSA